MPFSTVGIVEETYRGWTVRLEYRAGYGYSWVAWKDQQGLETVGGFLQSDEQSRRNAHWAIDKHEAAQQRQANGTTGAMV